jgi:hypothetical protein
MAAQLAGQCLRVKRKRIESGMSLHDRWSISVCLAKIYRDHSTTVAQLAMTKKQVPSVDRFSFLQLMPLVNFHFIVAFKKIFF